MESKLALAATATILLASLVVNVFFCSKQPAWASSNAAFKEEASELSALRDTLGNETAEFKDQLSQLSQTGPRLATRLGASDLRLNYSGQTTRLYISGEVWNVGTSAARNCKLHAKLYQGVAVANDTYIELGAIDAGAYVDVASDVYYSGIALTNWILTPEFG